MNIALKLAGVFSLAALLGFNPVLLHAFPPDDLVDVEDIGAEDPGDSDCINYQEQYSEVLMNAHEVKQRAEMLLSEVNQTKADYEALRQQLLVLGAAQQLLYPSIPIAPIYFALSHVMGISPPTNQLTNTPSDYNVWVLHENVNFNIADLINQVTDALNKANGVIAILEGDQCDITATHISTIIEPFRDSQYPTYMFDNPYLNYGSPVVINVLSVANLTGGVGTIPFYEAFHQYIKNQIELMQSMLTGN